MSCSALKARATVRASTGPRCGRVGPVRGSAGLDPKVPRAPARLPPAHLCAVYERLDLDPGLPSRTMSRIALLGGGKMGAALVGGLLDAGWEADALSIAEIDGERRLALEQQFPKVRVVPSAAWAVADADVVVVAVKPADVPATLETALPALGQQTLVVSIAAGVTIATVERLAPERPVVRAMPNTPAVVGVGASAIAPGTHARADHLEVAERLLGAVGIVVRVGEPALAAVTGLAGS